MKQRQFPRKASPGIVEVAASAGVSIATVSRYFNSPGKVRPATRDAIERSALELGYIRDRMAGAMHSRFSGTVGLVVPTIDNAIFSGLIEAFSNQLMSHDRTMLIACHNYDLALEVSIIRSLLERRIDGVAIVGQDHRPEAIDMLKARDVPVVALWGHQKEATIPFIGADNAEAAAKVTDHLLALGHRDIAFLFPGTLGNDRARERKEGALASMARQGLQVPANRIISCPYNIAASKSIAQDFIRTNRPTAVVCGNDIIAHGVIYAGLQEGLELPSDLSVVGIGDFAGSAEIEPGLTTVRLPAEKIGRMAANALVSMISDDQRSVTENQLLATTLIVRGSTCSPI